jgi:hypothetical protein
MGPEGLVIEAITLTEAVVFEISSNITLQSEPFGSLNVGTLIVLIEFRGIVKVV